MPFHVMRCMFGISASSYMVERWSLSFSTMANTPAGVSRPVVPVDTGARKIHPSGFEPFKLAQRRRERCCLACRCRGGFLRLVGRFGGLRGLASERLGTRRGSRDVLRVRHE